MLPLVLAGCGGVGPGPSASAVGSNPGSPSAAPAGKARYNVAVIRLNDPLTGEEAPDKDIRDGFRQSGLETGSVALMSYDAKGDPAAVPGLVDAALRDGASLIITLRPETTLAAASKDPKVPLVFGMTGEPVAMGLAKHDGEHKPNITGAYTGMQNSLIVPIARGCLPKAKAFGLLFNPDNPLSVACKEALLKTLWDNVEPVAVPYHADSEIPSALRTMVEKKVDALILVPGVSHSGAKAAIDEARRAKIPTFGLLGDHARNGAIVGRETNTRWPGFEAGRRAARVLKGEPTKQIPFVQGDNYLTYVNEEEAKSLGVRLLGAMMRDPIRVKTGEAAPAPVSAPVTTPSQDSAPGR
jgi:putative ABC transport system substrate-binding protein